MMVDRSSSKRNQLRQFILQIQREEQEKQQQQQQQQQQRSSPADRPMKQQPEPQSWMMMCHLYMLSCCPLFHPSFLGNGKHSFSTATLVPLMGDEVSYLSTACSPIVLQRLNDTTTDSTSSTALGGPQEQQVEPRHKVKRPPKLPHGRGNASSTTAIPPTPAELQTVSALIAEHRTFDLLLFAIYHGRIASVQSILKEEQHQNRPVLLVNQGDSQSTVSQKERDNHRNSSMGYSSGTPLHVAVIQCQADCVRALLSAGAQVSACMADQRGTHYNVLEIAAAVDQREHDALHAHSNVEGSDEPRQRKSTPLKMVQIFELWYMQAMYTNQVNVVQEFCRAGRSAVEPMLDGVVPLLIPSLSSKEMYTVLVQHWEMNNKHNKQPSNVEITNIEEHQQHQVVPWLEEQQIQVQADNEDGNKSGGATGTAVPTMKTNVQFRDIKCTIVFAGDTIASSSSHSSSNNRGNAVENYTEQQEVKSHRPTAAIAATVVVGEEDDEEQERKNKMTPGVLSNPYYVQRTSHFDVGTIDVLKSCINGVEILNESIQTMKSYCRSQHQPRKETDVLLCVKEYNLYVHGWVFYLLPPLPAMSSSSMNTTKTTTTPHSTAPPTPLNLHHQSSTQFVPDSMTACWSGWYVSLTSLAEENPLYNATLARIQKYLVGPLYYLTPIFHSQVKDLGRLCTPYRFNDSEVGGLTSKTMALPENVKRCIRVDVEQGGGHLYTRGTFERGMKKYLKLVREELVKGGEGNKSWMFMIVELRYNKMLKAWIEASRGVVR
jgi:ankyrin repeat protein